MIIDKEVAHLTEWQSGKHPDWEWAELKARPMIFWKADVCQGPQMGTVPFWGMYQGTQPTPDTATRIANSTTQLE